MDIYAPVKEMLKESGKRMSELQEVFGGITLQSLNKSLHGNITFERFNKIVEYCGFVILIGRLENGRAKDIRTLTQIEKEWEKK